MRHFKEIRLRVVGDPQLARRYVHEGRKYLGQLLETMARFNLGVGSRKLQNSDGVIFRLLSMGSVPIIEIDVQALTPVTEPRRFAEASWFVFRATVHAVLDEYGSDPFILVDPPEPEDETGDVFLRFFDDTTQDQFSPNWPTRGHYEDYWPDGIAYRANHDWRSTDDKWAVEIFGPYGRHYHRIPEVSSWGSKYVYIKGKQVFFYTTDIVGTPAETSNPELYTNRTRLYVTGACVATRTDEFDVTTHYLIISITENGASDKASNSDQYLLRAPLVPTFAAGVDPASDAWLAVSYELTLAELEVVSHVDWQADYWDTTLDTFDSGVDFNFHPMMFNQSGTECRTIREGIHPDATPEGGIIWTTTELVIDFSDLDDVQASFVTYEYPDVYTEVLDEYVGEESHMVDGSVWAYDDANTVDYYRALLCYQGAGAVTKFGADPFGGPGVARVSYVIQSHTQTRTFTDPPEADWIIFAVDYRDDVPVYAKKSLQVNRAHSFRRDSDYAQTGKTDNGSPDFWPVFLHEVTTNVTFSESYDNVVIKTDFCDLREQYAINADRSTVTGYKSVVASLGSFDIHERTTEVLNANSTLARTFDMEPLFLDLRYKWAVYTYNAQSYTANRSYSIAEGEAVPSYSTTSPITQHIVVTRNGVTLAETSFEDGSSVHAFGISATTNNLPSALGATYDINIDEDEEPPSVSPPSATALFDATVTDPDTVFFEVAYFDDWVSRGTTTDWPTDGMTGGAGGDNVAFIDRSGFYTSGSWIENKEGQWAYSMPWPLTSKTDVNYRTETSFGNALVGIGAPEDEETTRYYPMTFMPKTAFGVP